MPYAFGIVTQSSLFANDTKTLAVQRYSQWLSLSLLFSMPYVFDIVTQSSLFAPVKLVLTKPKSKWEKNHDTFDSWKKPNLLPWTKNKITVAEIETLAFTVNWSFTPSSKSLLYLQVFNFHFIN